MTFDDFKKIDLRVAKILAAERVEGSEKLVKLMVDLGEPNPLTGEAGLPAEQVNLSTGQAGLPTGRQVIAGIGKAYEPEQLIGKNIVVVANLEPRMLMGLESQGMLLAATDPDGMPVLLMPDREVPPGSGIK